MIGPGATVVEPGSSDALPRTPGRGGTGRRRWAWLATSIALTVPLGSVGCGVEGAIVPPEVISLESPFDYPPDLWDRGAEGTVMVMVHVTDTGGVDSVFVETSSGRPLFDSAAVAGAYELRFAPGRRGGERLATWVRLPVQFRKSVLLGERE